MFLAEFLKVSKTPMGVTKCLFVNGYTGNKIGGLLPCLDNENEIRMHRFQLGVEEQHLSKSRRDLVDDLGLPCFKVLLCCSLLQNSCSCPHPS